MLAALVFLFWAVVALLFHQYLSDQICGACATSHYSKDDHVSNKIENETSQIEEVEGDVASESKDNLHPNLAKGFALNSGSGTVVIPAQSAGFQDSIYKYLNANQDKQLVLSVQYLASEANDTMGMHLGKERIDYLKNILVKAGVNPDRIVTSSEETEFSYDENGNYRDGVSLYFQNTSEDRQAEIDAGVVNKTLYTNFAAAEFRPDRTLTAYSLELKNYLEKYPDKNIIVTGHTDSIGVNNYHWGLERAKNVKNYLVSQGIPSSKIKVVSKGETEPVATNQTEEGRAKNRRIEITVN